jgi:sortase A
MRNWSPDAAQELREAVPKRRSARIRRSLLLRVAGAVLLALAFGIGGYVGWLLWGTGLTTQHWQSELRPSLEKRIDTQNPSAPSASKVRIPGSAVAIIDIPKIDLNMVVVEGIDPESLQKGPGHYPSTAYPWQDHGRVGIAGHRTTYLHPFFNLDEVRPGDRITLATEYGTFAYRVTRVFVVSPLDSSVLDQTRKPTLVLTTCNPKYSASQRLIVTADRVDQTG